MNGMFHQIFTAMMNVVRSVLGIKFMPNRNQIAMKLREEKEISPEKFCFVKTCIYKTPAPFCPKHMARYKKRLEEAPCNTG